MDSKQFDTIVKSFGTAASRRRVLRGVTATALGALGLGMGRSAAQVVRCDPQTCAAQAEGNACITCQCQGIPGQGRGVQECVCTERTCPARTHCCPSGNFAGQCRRGACPG
jgi:hypothetical protein